jgi:hypothetical protein
VGNRTWPRGDIRSVITIFLVNLRATSRRVQASKSFLKPWKYFSRKSRWAGTWPGARTKRSPSLSAPAPSPCGVGAACKSNVGRGYDRDVTLQIVISYERGRDGDPKGVVVVSDGRCYGRGERVPADPTHQNPAASSQRLASRRRVGCPGRVPCTRLSPLAGRRPGARRA